MSQIIRRACTWSNALHLVTAVLVIFFVWAAGRVSPPGFDGELTRLELLLVKPRHEEEVSVLRVCLDQSIHYWEGFIYSGSEYPPHEKLLTLIERLEEFRNSLSDQSAAELRPALSDFEKAVNYGGVEKTLAFYEKVEPERSKLRIAFTLIALIIAFRGCFWFFQLLRRPA